MPRALCEQEWNACMPVASLTGQFTGQSATTMVLQGSRGPPDIARTGARKAKRARRKSLKTFFTLPLSAQSSGYGAPEETTAVGALPEDIIREIVDRLPSNDILSFSLTVRAPYAAMIVLARGSLTCNMNITSIGSIRATASPTSAVRHSCPQVQSRLPVSARHVRQE